jgi:hypothetical protein
MAHEMPFVCSQVQAENRLPTVRHSARLVAAEVGETVLDLFEVEPQSRFVVASHEARDRHVTALEDRAPERRSGDDLDLERLSEQRRAAQRREATDLGRVVRPALRGRQSRDHPLGRVDLDRRIRVPDLLGTGRDARRQLADIRQLEQGLRPKADFVLRGAERDAVSAARVIRVGVGEPVAQQARRAGEQLPAVERAAARVRLSESVAPECPMKRNDVKQPQLPAALSFPVRRDDCESQAQVVQVTVVGVPPVVRGVQEVGNPARRVGAGD